MSPEFYYLKSGKTWINVNQIIWAEEKIGSLFIYTSVDSGEGEWFELKGDDAEKFKKEVLNKFTKYKG